VRNIRALLRRADARPGGAAHIAADIRWYVDLLTPQSVGDDPHRRRCHIYRDGRCRYDHVLFETATENIFLVVVVDWATRRFSDTTCST
jgi:hypothetical protein